jgi:hypothetical protein
MRKKILKTDLDEAEFKIYLDQISKKLFEELGILTQLFFDLNYKKLKKFIIDIFINNDIDLKEYGFSNIEEVKRMKKKIKNRLKKILNKDLGGV